MSLEGEDSRTANLVDRAAEGDAAAREELLAVHRLRLRRMVACRLDPRIAARVDASDVVQEALIEANRKLDDYIRRRPLPFYLWLRQIAWERVVKTHRRHVEAGMRSVKREETPLRVSRESAVSIANRLVAVGTSPSQQLVRRELAERAAAALEAMRAEDREVLILRHVERLSVAEVAMLLGLTEGAVKLRRLRALRKLRELLGVGGDGASP
jgi:RNA polymerase sigma-70 factor, ECF subfamily